jgi:hypothetical protein
VLTVQMPRGAGFHLDPTRSSSPRASRSSRSQGQPSRAGVAVRAACPVL